MTWGRSTKPALAADSAPLALLCEAVPSGVARREFDDLQAGALVLDVQREPDRRFGKMGVVAFDAGHARQLAVRFVGRQGRGLFGKHAQRQIDVVVGGVMAVPGDQRQQRDQQHPNRHHIDRHHAHRRRQQAFKQCRWRWWF